MTWCPERGSLRFHTVLTAGEHYKRPVARVRRLFTTRPSRFSIGPWPKEHSFASCPLGFLVARPSPARTHLGW